MSTPLEESSLWTLHRATRREMQRRGFCARCAEQTAFAATDIAEGKPARKVEMCERCRKINENWSKAA